MVCLSRVAEGLVRALVSETDVGVALALGYDKSLLRRWTRHTETSLRHKVYRTSPKPVGSNLPPSSSNGHCTFLASLNAFASATCAYAREPPCGTVSERHERERRERRPQRGFPLLCFAHKRG
jgi:hypothetical protein